MAGYHETCRSMSDYVNAYHYYIIYVNCFFTIPAVFKLFPADIQNPAIIDDRYCLELDYITDRFSCLSLQISCL